MSGKAGRSTSPPPTPMKTSIMSSAASPMRSRKCRPPVSCLLPTTAGHSRPLASRASTARRPPKHNARFSTAVQMGDEANCAFNESNIIRFDGALDIAALKSALHRHRRAPPGACAAPSRKTAAPSFSIHPDASIELIEHDFSSLDPQLAVRAASALAHQALGKLDPVQSDHTARSSASNSSACPAEHHELIFTAHHMVCDGWSFGMILAELAPAYNARKAGRPPVLPPRCPSPTMPGLKSPTRAAGNHRCGKLLGPPLRRRRARARSADRPPPPAGENLQRRDGTHHHRSGRATSASRKPRPNSAAPCSPPCSPPSPPCSTASPARKTSSSACPPPAKPASAAMNSSATA